MTDLSGRAALVTGAARGQGRSHAVRLASLGADLVICDSCNEYATTDYPGASQGDLDETAAQVEKAGGRVISRAVDVRDLAGMEGLVADAVSAYGRLDVVVANAGIMSAGKAWELTEEQFDDVIGVNLKGTFITLKATVPAMIEAGNGGSIIVISSAAGRKAAPFVAHYTASKHGVLGLARAFALELGQYDIRVNSVHPVGVLTDMVLGPTLPKLLADVTTTIGPTLMNTLPYDFLQPAAVSEMVAWLAGDEARYCTAAEFVVDLGNTGR
jgi:SDR family mycofactocin-dependent oxidoreductase